MSAILSADDLNDFISPGVACIKPIETLPNGNQDSSNPYEVTTEDKAPAPNAAPAQISLTDCLACSGCVTSAEAVLISLQSHSEVLNALDTHPSFNPGVPSLPGEEGKIFIASISPQARASLAASYQISEKEAGFMIEQLLTGPMGLVAGGRYGSAFTWVIDTNVAREVCLVLGADEVMESLSQEAVADSEDGSAGSRAKKPVLTSACPGWICYAEKTHPHVLPHLSRLKSPQALLGTLLKTSLSRPLGVSPDRIWHMALMPCFDKKLEASRQELTDLYWNGTNGQSQGIRDTDCVITTRELLMLAESRSINIADLPRCSLSSRTPFPDPVLDAFLFRSSPNNPPVGGSSGGYLYHILQTYKALNPGSDVQITRGRNSDVVEYTLLQDDGTILLRTARYYGFRNIQNLVRKLKPAKPSRLPGGKLGGARKPGQPRGSGTASPVGGGMDYAYVEVMACPGGCTNGGAQLKAGEAAVMQGLGEVKIGPAEQKEWLARVDEAYYSGEESSNDDEEMFDAGAGTNGHSSALSKNFVNGINVSYVRDILQYWSYYTKIELDKLVNTSYRKIESDVGQDKVGQTQRVVELAGKIGGGW